MRYRIYETALAANIFFADLPRRYEM